MADPEKAGYPLVPARVYFHAENKRRYGVDRFDHGRIYRIQGGYRLSDRLRRAGIQARPRHDLGRHFVRAGRGHVCDRRTYRKGGHQKYGQMS